MMGITCRHACHVALGLTFVVVLVLIFVWVEYPHFNPFGVHQKGLPAPIHPVIIGNVASLYFLVFFLTMILTAY